MRRMATYAEGELWCVDPTSKGHCDPVQVSIRCNEQTIRPQLASQFSQRSPETAGKYAGGRVEGNEMIWARL